MSTQGRLLLDTHVWWWYLIGSERLPARIRRALDSADGSVWLSPISVWELGMLAARGRIEIEGQYRAWVTSALQRVPVEEAPLTTEVALKSREIELPYRDPADRFLAATALAYDLTLVTVDKRLVRPRWLPTLSA